MKQVSVERDAVRILCVLYVFGDLKQMHLGLFESEDYTHCIESENRLQKIDFWLRYPDYLAAALLHLCAPDGPLIQRSDEVKEVVRNIFHNHEPAIRWVPMRRYLRGAHEPLDNVLLFLTSRTLAYRRFSRRLPKTSYYLTKKGEKAVEQMIQECSEINWYIQRCQLIFSFLGYLEGIEMRSLQYTEPVYAGTPLDSIIERIDDQIPSRFFERFGETL